MSRIPPQQADIPTSVEVVPLVDPATLCATVRALALRSYRALTMAADGHPGDPPDSIDDLLRQIDNLQQQIRSVLTPGSGGLQRWVDTLRKRIEDLRDGAGSTQLSRSDMHDSLDISHMR
jgi:hypothetical protein